MYLRQESRGAGDGKPVDSVQLRTLGLEDGQDKGERPITSSTRIAVVVLWETSFDTCAEAVYSQSIPQAECSRSAGRHSHSRHCRQLKNGRCQQLLLCVHKPSQLTECIKGILADNLRWVTRQNVDLKGLLGLGCASATTRIAIRLQPLQIHGA